ncbi:hypothetical protein POM88_023025 [Heracleum sosnowskyi]|uniref:F-box domain-containing protein n=1 Tax=Heracleum sosnowskyi TaxID=360622 RepID=A0AAD8MQ48_9APIA|nr:hypothetical protein POM88_023025 [Heracleum sosnowskyi]
MASGAKTKQLDCGDSVDRISNLPCNLIDLILKRLPVHDAARMSILSKTWRDIWVMHPRLIFDDDFLHLLISKRFLKKDREIQLYEISRAISGILLAHRGPILKFCLYIPEDLPLNHYSDTIFWIKHVSNNGVRKLELFSHLLSAYKIPSYLFSCSKLTHLSLAGCTLTPPPKFEGFCNLITVSLLDVTITADMSFGAQLNELDLQYCNGIEHLGCQFKYYINLTLLTIAECDEVDLQWFECTRKVEYFVVIWKGPEKKIMDVDKLFNNMPRICNIHLEGFLFKFMEPGAAIMKKLIPTMQALKFMHLYDVGFYDLVRIQNVLCLIRISSNLQYLHIDLEPKVKSINGMNLAESRELMVSSVVQYLQSPNLIDMILTKLETVIIRGLVESAELQFIKLLLASSPSLKFMILSNITTDDPKEQLRISRELMRFRRASTAAEIRWT